MPSSSIYFGSTLIRHYLHKDDHLNNPISELDIESN